MHRLYISIHTQLGVEAATFHMMLLLKMRFMIRRPEALRASTAC